MVIEEYIFNKTHIEDLNREIKNRKVVNYKKVEEYCIAAKKEARFNPELFIYRVLMEHLRNGDCDLKQLHRNQGFMNALYSNPKSERPFSLIVDEIAKDLFYKQDWGEEEIYDFFYDTLGNVKSNNNQDRAKEFIKIATEKITCNYKEIMTAYKNKEAKFLAIIKEHEREVQNDF